ncbi:type I polyketide synthase [Streptomyces sp. NPDC002004]
MTSPRECSNVPRQEAETDHIAVIGLACRFPGARDPDEFWRNLLDGTDSVTRVAGARGIAARGLLEDPDRFDADYFGVSPREARLINPQHRVFLECAVEALENAGYDPARYSGSVGVYAGSSENAYAHILTSQQTQLPSVSDWEIRVANGADFLCSRVAHKLGLRGPAVAVQAACATSLVAVHLAVQGLISGDCDLALAGGVTIRLPLVPDVASAGGIQAPDGVCRAFDAGARGVVGGDGAGIVVLRRLVDALADGDRVDAVIRGSAVNNDGADRIGFTAPGVDGQAAVIETAQRAAGVAPDTCTYVEAHGTGTPLGDPVEVAALVKAFRRGTDRRGFCGIGSVKTNIGHTDAAAGVAGLVKTVLALKHAVIPPSLHYTAPHPEIDFETSPFQVVVRPREWLSNGMPRRAGVSSFGLGGTNAHAVLEQPPERHDSAPPERSWQVLPLSARTPTALATVGSRLGEHLRTSAATPLADTAWTLQTGRPEHPYRRFALVSSTADAARVLAGRHPDRLVTAGGETRSRPVTFRFPPVADLRTEHRSWARLYETEATFREAAEECGAGDVFRTGADGPAPLITFAGRYALARLWQSWGVEPAAAEGEEVGALAAATVAGVFRAADAARLVTEAPQVTEPTQLEDLIRRTAPRTPAITLRTTGAAERTSPVQATDPAYWAAYLRQRPRTDGTAATPRDGLGRIVLDMAADRTPVGEQALLRALGELWLSGARIDWTAVHRGRRPQRVALPTYPFEGQRYLVEAEQPPPGPVGTENASASARPAGSGTLGLVTALFAEILQLPEVEPDESFFDLGGDSLIATRFVVRAREVFPVELVPRTLFEAPTAARLAALIDARTTAGGVR